jgi:hypothetical protein
MRADSKVRCRKNGRAVGAPKWQLRKKSTSYPLGSQSIMRDGFHSPPIEDRKGFLAKLLSRPQQGIAFNQHYACDSAVLFKNACALGCEGIVSKQLGSAYR